MTADNFRGRFGSSNDKFCLSKIADYYDWTAYMDYYNYYPNGGWYWSPMYIQQAASPTENTSSTENDNELNEKDGIVSYGKRI